MLFPPKEGDTRLLAIVCSVLGLTLEFARVSLLPSPMLRLPLRSLRVFLFSCACLLGLYAAGPVYVLQVADLLKGKWDCELVGAPKVTPDGSAVQFGGQGDGLLVTPNPLKGLARFTVEARVRPAVDGGAEQRFVHFQDEAAHRALIELRMDPPRGDWSLDTHLFRDAAMKHTLLDRALVHSAGTWHWVALSYDGRTMRQYVDGHPEGEAEVDFPTLGEGRFSLGMRQDKRSWFKGEISELRVCDEALPADRLQR